MKKIRIIKTCLAKALSVVGVFIIVALSATGENTVSHSVLDGMTAKEVPECLIRGIGNGKGDRIDITFDLVGSEPFVVYKAEWVNQDTVKAPLDPFYMEADESAPEGKANAWHIGLEFPFTTVFGNNDRLIIHTDKGIISRFTSQNAQYEQDIKALMKNYDDYVAESKKSTRNMRIILWIVSGTAVISGAAVFISFRRRMARRQKEIEDLSMMIEERSERNLELKEKVNALYRSRLDTLNMLCNGYFDNNDSERMRDVFYKDVEKQILSLRDSKSIGALEGIVNQYLDNAILRIKEQMPGLTDADLKFLTYIYAGFSPRAVCVFMNIKKKTFYNRRNLLKERILASDAPDREWFVSLMTA